MNKNVSLALAVCLSMVLMAQYVHADEISDQKTKADLINIFQQGRSISARCDADLTLLAGKVATIKNGATWAAFPQALKDKINDSLQKLAAEKTACSDTVANIDTNFPNLND